MYRPQARSADSPKAVHFFQHFPSNFLRPYGSADVIPPESTIFRRIAPINCEWLLRPQIAASEFSETFLENLKYLSESESGILKKRHFQNMQDHLANFMAALTELNSLNNEGQASPDDVKEFLKTMVADDDKVDEFFHKMFKLGGSMYLLSSHYAVVKTLLSNPACLADKTVGTSKEVQDFKANPTIKGLKQYLTETCTTNAATATQSPTRAKRNLAQLLESDDERDNQSETPSTSAIAHQDTGIPKSQKKKNKKKHDKNLQ